MARLNIHLVYGNLPAAVDSARYEIVRRVLPHGEEDGETVDIRGPGNQPLTLDRAAGEIMHELGTVSLIPDARRVVIVYELAEFRAEKKGSVREAKKAKGAKADPLPGLLDYLTNVLPTTDNAVIFVFNEDDEKFRKVAKTAPLFDFVQRHGTVQEFSEKRIDWQFEGALAQGDAGESIRLLREWLDRGGSSSWRVVTTLNGFLQLLLQARLELDAKADGRKAAGMFAGIKPSLDTVPDFKARQMRGLAMRVPLGRVQAALRRLNGVQKSFFPTGDEPVVHDAVEMTETLIVELFG